MSILQKQKRKDPKLGYARDLIPLLEEILPLCMERNIKIITNGGGVNPFSCSEAILDVAKKLGLRNFKVGIVSGDDILGRIDELRQQGVGLSNMETGESIDTIQRRLGCRETIIIELKVNSV
jgi:hypothetical protein